MLKNFALVCFCSMLSSFVFCQVNLQTGSATFSLPVFSWQDHKSRLFSGVALNYNSGNGLKVNEIASNVGQGWNLQVGGFVSRIQVGEADDQKPFAGSGSQSEMDITKYPAGYLYATVSALNGCPNSLTQYPVYRSVNQVYKQHNLPSEDRQQDYFSFQFNGKTGMFILDSLASGKGIMLGDSKVKITYVIDETAAAAQNKRTTIKSFSIWDTDGLIYKFSVHSISKVLESNYCDADLIQSLTQPDMEGGNVYHQSGFENASYSKPWIVNGWYLSEVEDALTHRKIIFNYTTRSIDMIAGQDITYNENKDFSIVTHKRSITQTPELTSVTFPDDHLVTLNYGAERHDLKGQYVLSSIDITYGGRYISRHLLNTTYFILSRYGTPVSDFQKKMSRLCLKSVQKVGVDLKDDSPPYKFDYYKGVGGPDNVVPPLFTYSKDIWGFYNGSESRDYNGSLISITPYASVPLQNGQTRGLCYLRNAVSGITLNPKSGYAKNGLLRQIIYPTGGTLEYKYVQNYGKINGVERAVGGVHVSETLSTDGGYSNGCENPLKTSYNYFLNESGNPSSLWGLEMPANAVTTTNHYTPFDIAYKWKFDCLAGCCFYRFMYPGILSQFQAIDIASMQRIMATVSTVLGVVSVISTIVDVVTVICSSSVVMAWVGIIVAVIGGLVSLISTCTHDFDEDTPSTVYYNMDLNAASPLPTQFKRVEVVEGSGTAGKTIHEFTDDGDYAILFPTNPGFAAKQRFLPWVYGLPKMTTVYNASGAKVKETQNYYDFFNAKKYIFPCPSSHPGYECNETGLPVTRVNCKCEVTNSYSQRSTDWNNYSLYSDPLSYKTASTGDINVNFYGFFTGQVLLVSTSERSFRLSDANQYLTRNTNYGYYWEDNYDLESKIVEDYDPVANHVTEKFSETYYYTSQYTGGAITTLRNANIISQPVSKTVKYFKHGDLVESGIHETVTEFTQLANGDIKGSRMLEQRTSQPNSSMTSYGGPGSSLTNYKVLQTFSYDATGNLIGIVDEGGRKILNLKDYDDKYISATVINADPVADKAAYTSFESSGYGKWSLTGAAVYSSSAITGSKGFVLSAGKSFAATLNSAKAHKLSFWAMSGSFTVSGGATVVSNPASYNGFTYYEYNIPSGNSSVTVSGTGTIDELRVYPAVAKMRTMTYDPLIGKTAECDENNRIIYYEYDNLGRLNFVRDESKNIVKAYEYNNISESKQNGCPATYYNEEISEVFTKSNCGTGYLGGEYTYVVPANKYSSSKSQEDADAKAESEIIANGQNDANTNGACIQLYYNTVQSETFETETCSPGYIGGSVTYTVPADKYTSTINVAAANQLALAEIKANGQAYANAPGHTVCTPSTAPLWEWDSQTFNCQTPGGVLPARQFILERDINPSSATYNQTRWSDVGPTSGCPAGTYFSAQKNVDFRRSDCPAGSIGQIVTYTVPPGAYSSTLSQAAADMMATTDVNLNGQFYANTNGTCTPHPTCALTNRVHWTSTYFSIQASGVNWVLKLNTASDGDSFTFTTPVQVGTIGSGCRPSANRTVLANESGRQWEITVDTIGRIYFKLLSGTAPDEGVTIYIDTYYPL